MELCVVEGLCVPCGEDMKGALSSSFLAQQPYVLLDIYNFALMLTPATKPGGLWFLFVHGKDFQSSSNFPKLQCSPLSIDFKQTQTSKTERTPTIFQKINTAFTSNPCKRTNISTDNMSKTNSFQGNISPRKSGCFYLFSLTLINTEKHIGYRASFGIPNILCYSYHRCFSQLQSMSCYLV